MLPQICVSCSTNHLEFFANQSVEIVLKRIFNRKGKKVWNGFVEGKVMGERPAVLKVPMHLWIAYFLAWLATTSFWTTVLLHEVSYSVKLLFSIVIRVLSSAVLQYRRTAWSVVLKVSEKQTASFLKDKLQRWSNNNKFLRNIGDLLRCQMSRNNKSAVTM